MQGVSEGDEDTQALETSCLEQEHELDQSFRSLNDKKLKIKKLQIQADHLMTTKQDLEKDNLEMESNLRE